MPEPRDPFRHDPGATGPGQPAGDPGAARPGRPAGDPGATRPHRPPGAQGGSAGPGTPGGTLDDWLAAQVPPLPPPPGTLERIRKRARRRKLVQAASAAAGAAVIVLGVATLPQLVLSQLHPAAQPDGVVAGRPLLTTPARQPASRPSPAGSGSPAPSLPPVPPHFAPTSVTFVGTGTGWTIGQAGTPGQCTGPNPGICTSIARTDDYGRSWYGVPAPVTGPPDGSRGVSQIRFLNTLDGWAFGPQLWATHDGGQHWAQIPTHGLRVTALETSGTVAYAVLASCTGNGAAYTAGCTSFTLYSSPAGSDSWQPVPGAGNLTTGGAGSQALLLLTGGASYLLPPSGVLLAGPATTAGAAPWQPIATGLLNAAPCGPGSPGQGALLAAPGSGLAMLCREPGSGSAGQVFTSADGGKTWHLTGQATVPGTAASLAGSPSGTQVLATSQGIGYSTDGGGSWHPAQVTGSPPGGFSYAGMTTDQLGVAVPADPRQGALWFTYDGGRHWQPSAVSN